MMLEKGEREACAYWLPESLGAAARWLLPGAGVGKDGAHPAQLGATWERLWPGLCLQPLAGQPLLRHL